MQAILSGVLRGCGKQLIDAIITLSVYYLLGLPLAIVLVYVADMGAFGFLLGCTVANILQVTMTCHCLPEMFAILSLS